MTDRMHLLPKGADDQAQLWNGAAGRAWAEECTMMDAMLHPFQERLVAAVAAQGGQRVLDVGCGTGAVTLAIARNRPAGMVTGIDISAPMLAAAEVRARAAGLDPRFLLADAESHDFAESGFDLVVSRFGVMFFGQPVSAFANLWRATRPGGNLCFFAWRSAVENSFMSLAEKAASSFLPPLPPRQPHAPGQFAFADRDHVAGILRDSGWGEIDIAPMDVECGLPLDRLPTYLSRFGPLGRVMDGLEPGRRQEVLAHLLTSFAPFIQGEEARFTAACWQVNAMA
ncbi:class I SAM-dependent methyltransferase [Niveispirillum irakense]|uniref:class I SAM-dependent methyltransferase n=1 Tax=Niveispirillum irakense TaxID=34011 RepID=UPI0003FB4F99|nr:class I SAM-dependent methyltransferase [Niveispirillum irakense]